MRAEPVAESVWRFMAPNPGPKTLEGTNVYLAGERPAFLIDAGPDLAPYLSELANLVKGSVTAILLTHTHPDHAGGAGWLAEALDVPIYVSPDADEAFLARSHVRPIDTDAVFEAGRTTLRAVAMPGHARDHVCFWVDSLRLLFSGDNILGRGTTLVALPEGDMSEYMETLRRTRALSPALIAPGHGPMITNPIATIDEYEAHRREREREVLAALEIARTAPEIVDLVYQPANDDIRSLAVLSVGAQLAKLENEGSVEAAGDGRFVRR